MTGPGIEIQNEVWSNADSDAAIEAAISLYGSKAATALYDVRSQHAPMVGRKAIVFGLIYSNA